MLPSCRLSLSGGHLHVLVDGGVAPHAGLLRNLARVSGRVSVRQLPEGHDGLDWLTPIAPHVEELAVHDHGCKDLGALEHFTRLQTLLLIGRPHRASPPLTKVASTLREYGGPWFPALDIVLASRVLQVLMLEQPPRDLGSRLSAPLKQLRLLGARELTSVPVLSCTQTLLSLAISGGQAFDLTGVAAYMSLTRLDLHGRTPLTSFDELVGCASLRRLSLEECYTVDDVEALRQLTLDELRIIGPPERMDPELLSTARDLGVRKFSAPRTTVARTRSR